ncbi:hypothetical protein O6H91_11G111600 [Diphasiastrum complanatum]|uniref:Uncharacterized protein n=1 Tax=Diphasiastrum complanatum TaxID=34168 RepID=A0ACC2CCT5_DIPCM|nr:hypothetical protein O6H91_11G111600 [Diphasiastrum complanatum]
MVADGLGRTSMVLTSGQCQASNVLSRLLGCLVLCTVVFSSLLLFCGELSSQRLLAQGHTKYVYYCSHYSEFIYSYAYIPNLFKKFKHMSAYNYQHSAHYIEI